MPISRIWQVFRAIRFASSLSLLVVLTTTWFVYLVFHSRIIVLDGVDAIEDSALTYSHKVGPHPL